MTVQAESNVSIFPRHVLSPGRQTRAGTPHRRLISHPARPGDRHASPSVSSCAQSVSALMESPDPCPPHGSRQPSPVRPISPSQPAESSSSQSTGSSRSVSSNLPQTPVDPEIRPERHESDSVSESNESDTLSDTADDDEP